MSAPQVVVPLGAYRDTRYMTETENPTTAPATYTAARKVAAPVTPDEFIALAAEHRSATVYLPRKARRNAYFLAGPRDGIAVYEYLSSRGGNEVGHRASIVARFDRAVIDFYNGPGLVEIVR